MAELRRGNETREYWFEETQAVQELAEAIAKVQLEFNGMEGGSFTINEWGQVIVPSAVHDRRRYFVGDLLGTWDLLDPENEGKRVGLYDDHGLGCGDPWELPYVGVPYHLSKTGRLYFVHRGLERDLIQYAPYQDARLIAALRRCRRWGAVRFIVNPFGLVLTKRPVPGRWCEDDWDPVYVGKIDYARWFAKEVP